MAITSCDETGGGEKTGTGTEWWQDASASACLCPADAAECEASDCALLGVRALNGDGTYYQGVVRSSATMRSSSVVQAFHGKYEDLGGARFRFTPDDGNAFVVSVERMDDRLIVNNVAHTRAPDWLAVSLDETLAKSGAK